MPTSIDPQPAEDEFECARCGALVYDQLTRCPSCGVNLFEPEDESQGEDHHHPAGVYSRPGLLEKAGLFLRRLLRIPYPAEQVFGDALDQASLYNDLLTKTGGDREAAERLIAYESRRRPSLTRRAWLQSALQRWERDNRLHPGRR